jgi:tripartite-type tricarboxylate transporter receptor subunit TctC
MFFSSSRKMIWAALAGACFAMAPFSASAAEYPSKTIRIIVPVPPGGPTDVIARILAERLNAMWGKPAIVENKPGASGAIANDITLHAEPDGYTILIGNVSTNAITLAAYPNRQKEAALVGVNRLIEVPGVLTANSSLPVNSAQELVAKMKAGELKNIKYGSTGIGTYSQIDMLRFMKQNDLQPTHIAYKGAGQVLPAILSNEIQLEFFNVSTGLPLIKAGRLKGLAVTWPERLPELPDVPTMKELGYGDIGTSAWHGMFVPPGTPPAIVDKLYAATVSILQQPDTVKKLSDQSITVSFSKSPADFRSFVKNEEQRWSTIIKDNDIKFAGE